MKLKDPPEVEAEDEEEDSDQETNRQPSRPIVSIFYGKEKERVVVLGLPALFGTPITTETLVRGN